VLVTLAGLHARWWNAPALSQLRGVRQFAAVIERAHYNARTGALDARMFLERFGDLVHPALRPAYATLPDWLPRVAKGLAGNVTLVHLDCSAKNIYLPHDRNRAPLLFDWALFRCGPAALDLATLLCYSVDPAQHEQLPELTRRYHALLTERGVRGFACDELWHDFRLACLWRLAAPVHNAMYATAARDAHVRTIVPQLNSAILACRALELLPAL
jgi:Ser/Thr protein kinase RdoA (MazF antagonist)